MGEIYVLMGQPKLGLEIAMKGYKTLKPNFNFGVGFANYKLKNYSAAMIQFGAYMEVNKEYLSLGSLLFCSMYLEIR